MEDLSKKKCVPCLKGDIPLKGEKIAPFKQRVHADWKIVDEHHIEREYRFKNFKEALSFTQKIGNIAEEEGHHPDILLSWGKVKVTLWTHKIGGLSQNDFILAAKCDAAYAIL